MPAQLFTDARKAPALTLETPAAPSPARAIAAPTPASDGTPRRPRASQMPRLGNLYTSLDATQYSGENYAALSTAGLQAGTALRFDDGTVAGFEVVGKKRKDRSVNFVVVRSGQRSTCTQSELGQRVHYCAAVQDADGKGLWLTSGEGTHLGHLDYGADAVRWSPNPVEAIASLGMLGPERLLAHSVDAERLYELQRAGDSWTVRRWWQLGMVSACLLNDGKTIVAVHDTDCWFLSLSDEGLRPLACGTALPVPDGEGDGNQDYLYAARPWRGGAWLSGDCEYLIDASVVERAYALGASQPLWPQDVECKEEPEQGQDEDEGDDDTGDPPQDEDEDDGPTVVRAPRAKELPQLEALRPSGEAAESARVSVERFEALGLQTHLALRFEDGTVVGQKQLGKTRKDRSVSFVVQRDGATHELKVEQFGPHATRPVAAQDGASLWLIAYKGPLLGRLEPSAQSIEWWPLPVEGPEWLGVLGDSRLLVYDGSWGQLRELERVDGEWSVRRWWKMLTTSLCVLDGGKTVFCARDDGGWLFALSDEGLRPLAFFPIHTAPERGEPADEYVALAMPWRGGVWMQGEFEYFLTPAAIAQAHAAGASQPLWPQDVEVDESPDDASEEEEEEEEPEE